MSQSEKQQQKIVQYLDEARASERGLTRELQSQIAMTPARQLPHAAREAPARDAHPRRARRARLDELGHGANPLQFVGAARERRRPGAALPKTPLALVRGTGGEEKVLKNAKDACAAEALEIATYIAIERLARDRRRRRPRRSSPPRSARTRSGCSTASCASFPKLTDAVVRAEIHGDPSYDIARPAPPMPPARPTGGKQTRERAGGEAHGAPGAQGARRRPGRGSRSRARVASARRPGDRRLRRPHRRGDRRQAAELSQIDLAKVDAYERRTDNRTTVLSRIARCAGTSRGRATTSSPRTRSSTALAAADDELTAKSARYERAHKGRAGVLNAAERELATA